MKFSIGWVITGLSVFVFAAVAWVMWGIQAQNPAGAKTSILPQINALLNGTSAVLLVGGYLCIRRRKILAHKVCMIAAFCVSSVFLITYLAHHYQVGSVPFQGQGLIRAVYFMILIPHVTLAALIVPLALVTINLGWTAQYPQHVRLARWTLPLWLYVSVSGVLVYWMLYHLEF